MPSLDFPPAPLDSLTSELSEKLKQRTKIVLAYLVKTNSISTYFREAPLLSDFRETLPRFEYYDPVAEANGNSGDSNAEAASVVEYDLDDPQEILEIFTTSVPLSTYNAYLPFISRFFETPCLSSSVSNLLAPGLPYFIANSSATSGGTPKRFPKYRHPQSMSVSTASVMASSNPRPKKGGTNCVVYTLRSMQVVDAIGEDNNVARRMAVCLMSTGTVRMHMGLHVERDDFLMPRRAPNNTSPLAVSFISPYRTFLLMNVLFALADPSLEMINTIFSTTFFDFIRLLEEQWDSLVQAIDDGTIPELEGLEGLKDHLQDQLKPNPQRAAELRAIGSSTESPGWLNKLWPNLETVVAIASGPFASVLPKIRHYLGPSINIQSMGFTCSECFLALAYDPRDLNLFKVVGSDEVIEYLDIEKPEAASELTQAWDVQVGKKYEVVLTTRDGFWRYRLGDVVEIAGFDPTDGQPIIRYSERRNVMIRVANEYVTEKQLQNAIHSLKDTLGQVMEFSVIVDDRKTPRSYGFLVELQDEPGPTADTALSLLQTHLASANKNYARYSSSNTIGKPTIRVVAPGTFRAYREWRIEVTKCGSGQVKVPVVVHDVETREWLVGHVVEELGSIAST